MNKREFLDKLRGRLIGLPEDELAGHLDFYAEMIDDRMEEGLSEEEAVAAIGSIDEIEAGIISELSIVDIVKERILTIPRRTHSAWRIAAIVLLAPIAISLAATAFSLLVSVYACMWAAILSLWCVFAALSVGAPCAIASGIILAAGGSGAAGAVMTCAGLVSAGLAIFSFFGCKEATRGAFILSKRIIAWVKSQLIRRAKGDE